MFTWLTKHKDSYFIWLVIILFFLGLYGIVNHLTIDRHIIPFILGEEKIPFLPWTFLIYLSIFLQYFVVIRHIPHSVLGKLFSQFLWIIGISLVLYIVFPIEYPRDLYMSNNFFVTVLRSIDAPGNCFPSLHVIETVFMAACYSYIETKTWYKVLMWIWTTLIIISVLTTKQHYLVDIFGGILLVTPFLFIIKKDLSH